MPRGTASALLLSTFVLGCDAAPEPAPDADDALVEDTGPRCGNGVCSKAENSRNCPEDCGELCGDGVCGDDESTTSCPCVQRRRGERRLRHRLR